MWITLGKKKMEFFLIDFQGEGDYILLVTIVDDEIRKRAVRQEEAARFLQEEIGIRGKAGRIARDRQNTQLGLRQRKPEHTNNKQTPQRQ